MTTDADRATDRAPGSPALPARSGGPSPEQAFANVVRAVRGFPCTADQRDVLNASLTVIRDVLVRDELSSSAPQPNRAARRASAKKRT